MDLKQYSDALNEARIAMDTLAATGIDLTDLKIVAAKAQDGLGQASQAANFVAPLLKTVTDPVQIDDIARILAEGSAYLPEAEAAEAKLIDADEAESASWTVETKLPRIQQAQQGNSFQQKIGLPEPVTLLVAL